MIEARPLCVFPYKRGTVFSVGQVHEVRELRYPVLPDNKSLELCRSKVKCDAVWENPIRLGLAETASTWFFLLLQAAHHRLKVDLYGTNFLKCWHGLSCGQDLLFV